MLEQTTTPLRVFIVGEPTPRDAREVLADDVAQTEAATIREIRFTIQELFVRPLCSFSRDRDPFEGVSLPRFHRAGRKADNRRFIAACREMIRTATPYRDAFTDLGMGIGFLLDFTDLVDELEDARIARLWGRARRVAARQAHFHRMDRGAEPLSPTSTEAL